MFLKRSLSILNLCLFVVFTSLKSTNVSQMQVARQQTGGSCGYHALRNGLLIAESFKNPSSKQLLTNESLVEEFETSESNWYKSIIRYRSQKLAAYYIKDSILKKVKGRSLKDDSTSNRCYALNLENKYIELKELKDLTYPDERHFFCNLLIEVASKLSIEAIQSLTQEVKYEITRQRIIEIFQEEIKKHEPRYNQSSLSKKIKYFFSKLKVISFSIVNDSIIKNSKEEIIYQWDYRNNNMRESSSTVTNAGEWLSSQEINRLVQEECNKNNSYLNKNLNKVRIFVLDDQLEQQFKQEENLKEFVHNLQKDSFNGIAIFVIYHSSHWITCVINKQKNKPADYIFADSLNIDRLKDENTLKLINLLTYNFNDENSINESNIQVEYTKTNLPPLELLLQGRGLIAARHIISQLKKNEDVKQGLLLQGPSGVGKHTIAQVIAQQSGKELISTLQEEVKASLIQEVIDVDNDSDKKSNLEERLLSLIKKAYNKKAILLICKIEDFLQTNAFNRLSRIAYKNPPFLVIGITRDNTILKQDKRIRDFLLPVNIGLPTFDLRRNILCFYLKSNKNIIVAPPPLEDSSMPNNEIHNAALDALTTATRSYSGSELEEIITNAIEDFNQQLEVENPVSFFYRWKHEYDFKDQKFCSLSASTFAFLIPLITASFPSKIEQHLWSTQQAYDQERDKKVEPGYLDKAKKAGLITKDYAIYYGKKGFNNSWEFVLETCNESIKEVSKEATKEVIKEVIAKHVVTRIKEKAGLNNNEIVKELTMDEMINKNLNSSKEKVAELIANDITTEKILPELRKKWGLKEIAKKDQNDQ